MVKLAEATKLRKAKYLATQKEIRERDEAEDACRKEKESEDLGRGKRVRKLHWKLKH